MPKEPAREAAEALMQDEWRLCRVERSLHTLKWMLIAAIELSIAILARLLCAPAARGLSHFSRGDECDGVSRDRELFES